MKTKGTQEQVYKNVHFILAKGKLMKLATIVCCF